MMINTVMEMKNIARVVLDTNVLYMLIACIFLQKRGIVLCICLLLCDAGQKYD